MFIRELYFEYKLDCLGKNGSYVTAQAVDLTAGKDTVIRHINQYELVKNYIDKKNNGNKYFLITNIPNTDDNQKIIENLKRTNNFDILQDSQTDEILDYFDRKKAGKVIY